MRSQSFLFFGSIVTLLILSGCVERDPAVEAAAADAASDASAAPGFDLASASYVDLTHPFDEDTIYWPTSTDRFELERLAYGDTERGWFYSSFGLSTPEHGGTHLDAPVHFAEGRWSTEEIPLDRLILPAVVIDVSAQAAADTDYRLTVADVEAWEEEHGPVPAGVAVLLHTGWDERWPDALSYLGDDTPGDASNLHFPSYGVEATRLLVEERGVALLGVDTASLDHGPDPDFPVHRVANGANVPGLENLTRLDELPPTGAWLLALPMKIAGGSGGPVRVVGLIDGRG